MIKNHEINFTKGKIMMPILMFCLPLILSGMLQLLYNAADVVVVGKFAGKESLAAVGSTTSLTHLFINIFVGLSSGANVLISKAYGTNDEDMLFRATHTSIMIGLIGGVIFAIAGFVLAESMLVAMGTPDDVIDKAALYVRIYFVGVPATALYNFGSAILRAVGDTRRPLYFLTISGVVNVILNLIFVIAFKMDVAGVALATAISQFCSAVMVIVCLVKSDSAYRLVLEKLRIYRREFYNIVFVGLPAGIQGSLFSFSNVIIQSSINSFGTIVVAANSAAVNAEGFVYAAMNAVHHAAVTFTAQNFGVKNFERIKKGTFYCLGLVSAVGILLGGIVCLFAKPVLSIYSSDAEVVAVGTIRLMFVCAPYFLCGIMDVMQGILRGFSYSLLPMIIVLLGVCILRILWIYTVFSFFPMLKMLYIIYPISWALTFFVLFGVYKHAVKKLQTVVKI